MSSKSPIFFHLVPLTARAREAVAHCNNEHLRVQLDPGSPDSGSVGLAIGPRARRGTARSLATLGRGPDADVFIPGSSIARLQCSFEVIPETGIIMFYDRSNNHSTQVSGHRVTPFEYGRPRRVVVLPHMNNIIGMGGRNYSVQFQLLWQLREEDVFDTVKKYYNLPRATAENPQLALTTASTPADIVSGALKVRYHAITFLGRGQFGVVCKAIDMDSGRVMAVKRIGQSQSSLGRADWEESLRYALEREVEALSRVSHPNVVDFIASQDCAQGGVEIFMGFMDGNLEQLIHGGTDPSSITRNVCQNLLSALDCLACSNIIHRDVKPTNVLFVRRTNGDTIFQLGDFGLCNCTSDAQTLVGTPIYMAPEFQNSRSQTPKVDVWSLFVTMLWVVDFDGFRQAENKYRNPQERREAVIAASNSELMSQLKEMAVVQPRERASAAQMLVKLFGGHGLTTPRHLVPVLPTDPLPQA